MRYAVLLILCAGLVMNAAGQNAAKDEDKLQGSWKVVAAERDGKKQGDDIIKNLKMAIKGDKLILKDGDKEQEAVFKIDAAKKPKTLDINIKAGEKLETIKGIYLLEGDDLKICAAADPSKDRPTEFITQQGSGVGLLVFKREKP